MGVRLGKASCCEKIEALSMSMPEINRICDLHMSLVPFANGSIFSRLPSRLLLNPK